MFKELDSLDYSTLIKLCYGVFAEWNSYSGATHRMPSEILTILHSFIGKYRKSEYKDLLALYIKERTANEWSSDMRSSGQAFLDELLR